MQYKYVSTRALNKTAIVIGLLGPVAVTGASAADAATVAACTTLVGKYIPASDIGLPTNGAAIIEAAIVAAKPGTTPSSTDAFVATSTTKEYCRVTGVIRPVDPTAQDITFAMALPTQWNGKGFQIGGGGYDGVLVDPAGTPPQLAGLVPVDRGYAAFSSDGGHKGSPTDASFALNEEQLVNFGSAQIKKTRDVAMSIIKTRYGAAPKRTYFGGSSNGGREALMAAQKWPQDYDGILVNYPAWNMGGLTVKLNSASKANYSPGGWLNQNKVALLNRAVLNACDSLDGASDGIVSNVGSCRFDVTILRCPSGRDEGDACLSDTQIRTVKTYDAPLQLSYSLHGDISAVPGYSAQTGGVLDVGNTSEGTNPAVLGVHSIPYVLSDSAIKYMVTRNASYDSLRFEPETGGAFQNRVVELSKILQPANFDMRAFERKGAKIILAHGWNDGLVPASHSIDFFNRLNKAMGPGNVDRFVKFYMIPGLAHGGGAFDAWYDSLAALEAWVERGNAPGTLTAVNPSNGHTRPVCVYPSWPKYKGAGDINSASSYACATS